MLLDHSETEREIVRGIMTTKEMVSATDELAPTDDQYYNRLQAKIMDRISAEDIRPNGIKKMINKISTKLSF
jgi:hypothetical protein